MPVAKGAIRAPKWQRRPEERRGEIIEAAVGTFGRLGYQRATLADVAELAGVSPGTVSHYFGSKSDLFEAVIADRFVRFVANEEALLAADVGSARLLLEQLLRRLWEHTWAPGTIALMQAVQVDMAEFPDSGRLLCKQLSDRWRRLFGAILERGIRSGEFRRLDVDAAARTIGYALLGVAQKAATFARFDATMPGRERLWAAVLEMVERFVLADAPAAKAAGGVRKKGSHHPREVA
jgi:AcrR family transcriptional regulator